MIHGDGGLAMNTFKSPGAVIAILTVILLLLQRYWKGLPQFVWHVWEKICDLVFSMVETVLPTVFHRKQPKKAEVTQEPPTWLAYVRPVMAVIVSVVLGTFSGLLIFSTHTEASDKKWAYGTIGTIVGYWLK